MKKDSMMDRKKSDKKKVMIIAGEASGDMHGAHLVRAMTMVDDRLSFFGIGGNQLKAAGVEIRVDNREMAVVGISEAIVKLKTLAGALRIAKRDLKARKPDLLIVIDFPDFNLLVATEAKKLGIPVMYYISPQIWAWRTSRVKRIKRLVDHMVVIFPFEVDFYRRWNVPVTFVGHPLLDHMPSSKKVSSRLLSSDNAPVVGLLPGSRNEEVVRLLPSMIEVADILSQEFPRALFPVPVASSVDRNLIALAVKKSKSNFLLLDDGVPTVFQNAALVVTASGTVTLEAALAGVPMIVIYRVSRLSYWIGKRLIRVKHIGLANLVAGRQIVPELIQDDASPQHISREAASLLRDERALARMRQDLGRVARLLGTPGASRRAAQVAFQVMGHTEGVHC